MYMCTCDKQIPLLLQPHEGYSFATTLIILSILSDSH